MARKLIPMAIAYDFDGTLAPGNIQENSFIPAIGMKARADKLITDKRADFIAPADYSDGKRLDKIVRAIIDKVAANDAVRLMKRE